MVLGDAQQAPTVCIPKRELGLGVSFLGVIVDFLDFPVVDWCLSVRWVFGSEGGNDPQRGGRDRGDCDDYQQPKAGSQQVLDGGAWRVFCLSFMAGLLGVGT